MTFNVRKSLWSIPLVGAVALSGCYSTRMPGEYRTSPSDVVNVHSKKEITSGSQWLFFWGLISTGTFDVNKELRRDLRPDEAVTDVEVYDHLSVGGFFLWLITAGIVSHHDIDVDGSIAEIRAPEAAPAKERETIVVPEKSATPPPERTPERTPETEQPPERNP